MATMSSAVRGEPAASLDVDNWFDRLRAKWHEIPSQFGGRVSSHEMLALPDEELVRLWQSTRDAEVGRWKMRGWYHTLYRSLWPGARVIDYGSGFGLDGISWAQAGAHVTFADIVPDNLQVLRRLTGILGLGQVAFLDVRDFSALDALGEQSLDVIWAQGSLHHAPFEFIQREVAHLVPKLRTGGRWIQLTYPPERWLREGARPFSEWGRNTDGDSTPWAEWYDLEKLEAVLAPHRFDCLLSFNFHDDDFNWFDLVKRD